MKERNTVRKKKTVTGSFYKTLKSFVTVIPILLGIILLLGLFRSFVSKEMITSIFTGKWLPDTLTGSLIGSISAGNPVSSYIIGGELLKEGISLFAVTAFIVAWVTVGVLQFPLEAATLGARFALARNVISFVLSILVALATVLTLTVVG